MVWLSKVVTYPLSQKEGERDVTHLSIGTCLGSPWNSMKRNTMSTVSDSFFAHPKTITEEKHDIVAMNIQVFCAKSLCIFCCRSTGIAKRLEGKCMSLVWY